MKSGKLGSSTTNQDLTHGWGQMCHSDPVLLHPLGQELMSYIVRVRANDLGAKKERRENIPLNGVMGNA